MPSATSKPRDAASLVIHREHNGRLEVLMGRRGERARFKPGVYVFPGGGLERADYRARPASLLPAAVTPQMAVGMSPRKANALAMAAVREAWEEAGLLFGVAGDIGHHGAAAWAAFRHLGLAPDLGRLEFLGRAITPAYRSLRYHARFFAIPWRALQGELGGDGELEDLRWVRADNTGEVEMMVVQELMIKTLAERHAGRAAPATRLHYARGSNRITPLT